MNTTEIVQVESPATIAVVRARLAGLSVEQAFEAWTEPDQLVRWWPQQVTMLPRAESAPGAGYVLEWPGMSWRLRGVYLVWECPQLLVFSWQWDHEPNLPQRMVTARFVPGPEHSTELLVTHGVYGESQREQEDRQSHIDGWLFFLDRLASLAGQA